MLWSCILMIVAAFYFEVILRLWEKNGFLYLFILLPFLPILAIFSKTRKMITWENAKKIARENNFLFSFEWVLIFITKTISMVFSVLLGIVNLIIWTIKKDKYTEQSAWRVYWGWISTTWRNITFSRIKADKSLYSVEPYIFIEHDLNARLDISV